MRIKRLELFIVKVWVNFSGPPPTADPVLDKEEEDVGQKRLLEMSKDFFGRVQGINVAGQSIDIATVKDEYSRACPFDHIG